MKKRMFWQSSRIERNGFQSSSYLVSFDSDNRLLALNTLQSCSVQFQSAWGLISSRFLSPCPESLVGSLLDGRSSVPLSKFHASTVVDLICILRAIAAALRGRGIHILDWFFCFVGGSRHPGLLPKPSLSQAPLLMENGCIHLCHTSCILYAHCRHTIKHGSRAC